MTNIPSFSYKNTKRGIVATIAFTVALLVGVVVFFFNPNQPYPYQAGGTGYPASLPSIAAGCGDVYRVVPAEDTFGVIPDKFWELNKESPTVAIPMPPSFIIPTFGYMGKEGLAESDIRFYTRAETEEHSVDLTKILRSMYDRDILVIYYTSDVEEADLATLRSYATIDRPGEVLVLPWTGNRGMIQGRDIAFSTWGISQTCANFSEMVLQEFAEFAKENRVERPSVIPEAKLTTKGTLYPIGGQPTESD